MLSARVQATAGLMVAGAARGFSQRRPGVTGRAPPAVPRRRPSAYKEGRGHGQDGESAAGEAARGPAPPPPASAADAEKAPAWAASMQEQLTTVIRQQSSMQEQQSSMQEQQSSMQEQLTTLNRQQSTMQEQLTTVNRQQEKIAQISTGTFEALVRSQPDFSGPIVVRDLQHLACLLSLPTQDLRPVYEALAQPEVLHLLRRRLVGLAKKSRAREGKAEAYQAALTAWCTACDQPRTAAEWQEDEALAREMLKCFVVNSQPHRAFRLWLAVCPAAAEDAASPGGCGTVQSLLRAEPQPLMWQPEMTVAAALAGACQPQIELDLPVEVQRTAAASMVKIKEVKAAANAIGAAKVQLERVVRLCAWLHAVLGLPQPQYVGCVVVPYAQKAEASRELDRSLQKQVEVPQGHGKVSVTWQLRAV